MCFFIWHVILFCSTLWSLSQMKWTYLMRYDNYIKYLILIIYKMYPFAIAYYSIFNSWYKTILLFSLIPLSIFSLLIKSYACLLTCFIIIFFYYCTNFLILSNSFFLRIFEIFQPVNIFIILKPNKNIDRLKPKSTRQTKKKTPMR